MSSMRAGFGWLALAAALLAAVWIGRGHGGRTAGAAEGLGSVKVGQWVQIEGIARPDSASRCDEIRLLTGDFLDDDWALKGYVQAVDAAKREFAIGGVRVQVTENTAYDSPSRTVKGFADLRSGLLVELEGTYLKGRRFLAMEVDDESDELVRTPWAPSQIMLVGKVEQVDPRKRLVTAMGLTFQVTEKTRLRSVIQ